MYIYVSSQNIINRLLCQRQTSMIFNIYIKYTHYWKLSYNHLHISIIVVLGKIYEMMEEWVTPLVYKLTKFVTVGLVVGWWTTDNTIWSLGACVLSFIHTSMPLCLFELTEGFVFAFKKWGIASMKMLLFLSCSSFSLLMLAIFDKSVDDQYLDSHVSLSTGISM